MIATKTNPPSRTPPKTGNVAFDAWMEQFARDTYLLWQARNEMVSPDGEAWKVDNSGNLTS